MRSTSARVGHEPFRPVEATSAAALPLRLVLDRPFLVCVHDVALQLPLLLGVVADPGASVG